MQKSIRKLISVALILVFVLSIMSPGFAAQKISNPHDRGGIDGIDPNPEVGLHNSYAWCSEMFQQTDGDYLWVGMNRDIGDSILGFAATANDGLSFNSLYGIPPASDDKSGKIYRQRASDPTAKWELVYENPAIRGYRRMIIFNEDLYVVAGSTNRDVANYSFVLRFPKGYKSGDAPEIVLWETLPTLDNQHFRSATIFEDKLYIGTFDSRIFATDGKNLKNLIPNAGANAVGWDFVMDLKMHGIPEGAGIWDMLAFNGAIYAFISGAPVQGRGFGVIKITPEEEGYSFKQILGDAQALYPYGFRIHKNAAASPFLSTTFGDEYVYVTTFNSGPAYLAYSAAGYVQESIEALLCPAQIYRFNKNDVWEVLVGDTFGEFVAVDHTGTPIPHVGNHRAGFFLQENDEINTSTNQYIWWMAEYEGKLYTSTWDTGVFADNYFLSSLIVADRIMNGALGILFSYSSAITEQLRPIISGISSGDLAALTAELKEFFSALEELLGDGDYREVDVNFSEILDEFFSIIEKHSSVERENLIALGNIFMELTSEIQALELNPSEIVAELLAYVSATAMYFNDKSNPYGFDLYVSEDGKNFHPVVLNGFGDPYNYGGRVLVPSEHGLFSMTANPFQGGQVWRVDPIKLGIYPNGPREALLSEGDEVVMTVLVNDAASSLVASGDSLAVSSNSLVIDYESDLVEVQLIKRSTQTAKDFSWEHEIKINPENDKRYYDVTEIEKDYLTDFYDVIITPLENGRQELVLNFSINGITSTRVIDITVDLDYVPEIADKTVLEIKLAEAAGLKQEDYTPGTWNAFVMSRNAAQTVYENENATQAQVDVALANLMTAMENLVPRPDKSRLGVAWVVGSALVEEDFTAESWPRFALAQYIAGLVFAGPNQNQAQVDAAFAELIEAMSALVPVDGIIADKSALADKLAEAAELEQNDYTSDSWVLFEYAHSTAWWTNVGPKQTQAQVDAALADLVKAMEALVPHGGVAVDKSALAAKLKEVEDLNQEDYTLLSWGALVVARIAADAVYNDDNASQAQVEEALESLTSAITNLVPLQITTDKTVFTAQKVSNPNVRGGVDGIDPNPAEGLHNSYAWCSEVFKQTDGDYLWIGMNRDHGANIFGLSSGGTNGALDLLPILGIPKNNPDPSGKIYRQRISDPNAEFELVYENPVINGYRRMIVFDEDLYVLVGLTIRRFADYSIVLRFSKDFQAGDSPDIVMWEHLPAGSAEYFRAATVFEDKLYIGTWDSKIFVTDGKDLQNLTPGTGEKFTGWELALNLPDYDVFPGAVWDLVDFNGSIYTFIVGAVALETGFSLCKITPDAGSYAVEHIVGGPSAPYPSGFGMHKNTAASGFVSTAFDKDYVYVTTFANGPAYLVALGNLNIQGAFETYFNPAQMYRFDRNDNWEVVVGDTSGHVVAKDSAGNPLPYIGNQRAGFFLQEGDYNVSYNQYIWWMAEYNGKLYATTWDMSSFNYLYPGMIVAQLDSLSPGAMEMILETLYPLMEQLDLVIADYSVVDYRALIEEIREYLQELDLLLGDIDYREMEEEIRVIIGDLVAIINKHFPQDHENLRNLINTTVKLVTDVVGLGLDPTEVITAVISFVSATAVYYLDRSNPVGFDLYVSEDGKNFKPASVDGLGDGNNFGGRVLVPSEHGLFLTTANPFKGGQAWRLESDKAAIYPNGPREAFLADGDKAAMTVLVTEAKVDNDLELVYESDLVEVQLVRRGDPISLTNVTWETSIEMRRFTGKKYYSITETESVSLNQMYDVIITPLKSGQENLTLTFNANGLISTRTIAITVDLDSEPPVVDKEALAALIKAALELEESDYTPATWAHLVGALDDAQFVYGDDEATQEQVDEACEVLALTIEALEKVIEPPVVDKEALAALIAAALERIEADYTAETWAPFAAALACAQFIYDEDGFSQEEVDEAYDDLLSASNALVQKQLVDKSLLALLLSAARNLEEADYTPETWAPFAVALDAAQAVYDNEYATEEQVEEAFDNLSWVMVNLAPALPDVDKTRLEALLEEARQLEEKKYTAVTWQDFALALASAEEVYTEQNATQDQVDGAFDSLFAAMGALKLKPIVDRSALEARLAEAALLNQSDYTTDSWSAFAAIRTSAQSVYSNAAADQGQINAALAELTIAIRNLIPAQPQGTVVYTMDQLKAALANPAVSTIIFGNNITTSRLVDPRLVLNHSVDIYGQNYTLDLNNYSINMESSGTLRVCDLNMKTTDRYGFFSAYAASVSKAGVWNIELSGTTFEGSALAGQRTASVSYGMINSVSFTGKNTVRITGLTTHKAAVYARNITIDGDFNMLGANNSIFFKSSSSSGLGTGVNAYGSFIIAPGANVNMIRSLSSNLANTYTSNLIEGYENHIFGENSVFSAIAGTNLSASNTGYNQTAIIYSGAAKEFTVKNGAQVDLISDSSLANRPATHGSTALSLRKPAGGRLDITVQPGARLNIEASGTNARSRSLAPVIISSRVGTNSGASYVLIQGELSVYSRNGNGWYYQYTATSAAGHDYFTVDGGEANIIADGEIGRAASGEYAAFEHYSPLNFDLEVKNGGHMNIKTNGWRAMSLAGVTGSSVAKKTITVSGTGSELYITGGQMAISAEGKSDFTLNVLGGGYVSTRNTQDSNIFTRGRATYNIDGPGSRLEMVRTGVSDDPSGRDRTSLYGVIFHDAPLVGPLTINVTNGAYMSAENNFGSRAAITAQSNQIATHAINVTGANSTLIVINNNKENSSNTTLYPLGAIAFAANCSGNINVLSGGILHAESNSPNSPTIALGNSAASSLTGVLTVDNPGEVDIRNDAETTNIRAIALRGRNYDPARPLTDTAAALIVRQGNIAAWKAGLGADSWPEDSMVDLWENVTFTAFNSAPSSIVPGSLNGFTQFTLASYGRISVDNK